MEALAERLMYTTQAWEELHDPQVGGMVDAEGMLELCKAAGFSEDEAQKAASRRGFDRLKKNQPA